MPDLRSFGQRTFNKLGSFLAQQQPIEPLLILIIIMVTLLQTNFLNQGSLYIFCSFLAVFIKWNVLFALPFWIQASSWPISIITLIVSAASCTCKWKIYIFIFISLVGLYNNQEVSSFAVAAAALFIVVQTAKNLIFQTVQQNIYYFTGFFSLSITFAALALAETLGIQSQIPLLALLVVAAAKLGYQLINQRIYNVRKQINNLKDPHILALCLECLHQSLEDSDIFKVELKLHKKNCNKTLCFCRENDERKDYFERQLFKNAINKFIDADEPLLNQLYVNHLLSNYQLISSLNFLINWKPRNYFSFLCRLRCFKNVTNFLQDGDSSNKYQDEYTDGLKYDSLCLKLSTDIYQVLGLKVDFWKQLAKEEPKLEIIQKKGLLAVEKMYELNKFYGQKIKAYEQTLNSFNATALYITFLISSTSFKDYSKELIKKTSKRMENISLDSGSGGESETFTIKTIIKDENLSLNVQSNKQFETKAHPHNHNKKRINKLDCVLVISHISTGVCNFLKIAKIDIIGRELNTLIPHGYKEVHNIRINQLLNFKSEQINQDMTYSTIFHKEFTLPIRGANGQLHTGQICIRFHSDINQGIGIFSIIKKISNKASNALISYQGNKQLVQKQINFPVKVLQHSQTIAYIDKLKRQWNEQKIIHEQNFSIMMNGTIYEVKIYSPLIRFFLSKQSMKQKQPPIHIEIKDNSNSNKINLKEDRQMFQNRELDNVGKVALQDRQSSVTSTEKSVTSAVSILSTFSQNNSVPLYRYIALVIIVVLILCLVGNVLIYLKQSLSWDGSVKNGNPITQFMSLYEVIFLGLRSESSLLNARNYYNYNNVLNQTRINDYLNHQNYQTQINAIFQQTEASLKQSLANIFSGSSNVLGQSINSILETSISVTNMGQLTVAQPSFYNSHQNLTYREIQMLCASDYSYLQSYKIFDMISVTLFSTEVVPYIKGSTVKALGPPIYASIDESAKSAQTFGIICTLCLLPLIIPIFLILRKRFALHERVFDLLTSVDVEEIQRQINVLLYTSKIISNYLEVSGQLKNNILRYQQNNIVPAMDSTQRCKTLNQMVVGLQQEVQEYEQVTQGHFLAKKGQKSQIETSINTKKNMGIFGLMRKKMASIGKRQLRYKKRRRMGELDVRGSQYDPDKKFIAKHCIFYVMVILFMTFMIGGIKVNEKSATVSNSTLTDITEVYANLMSIHSQLKRVSYYIWEGSTVYQQVFRSSVESNLLPRLNQMSKYYTFTGNETSLISACTTTNQTICQVVSSIRIIEGEVESIAKEIVQARYQDEINNVTTHLYDVFQRLFYVQVLCNRLYRTNTQVKNYFFDEMLIKIQGYKDMKLNLLKGAIALAVVCAFVSLYMIHKMKKKYLKEVYMLTFLNEAMIIKNKRIQSYLDALLKSK